MPNGYVHSKGKKRKSKESAMKAHLEKRFAQRFGIQLTRNLFEYILGKIHHNQTKHVCNQSRTRAVHIVRIPIPHSNEEKEIVVIYNKARKMIHTVFPTSWLTDGSYEEYMKRKSYINGEDYND